MFLVRITHTVIDRMSLFPPSLFVEDLIPSVTAFGDRAYNEIIKVIIKRGHNSGALIR